MEKIKKWWDLYWNWLFELPDGISFFLACMSVIIPIAIAISILISISDVYQRSNCLDSEVARRWNEWTCEEFQDNAWIEVDLSKSNIYYYNEAGSRK